MTDPHSAIPEHVKPELWRRYEDWRVRRYERAVAKNAHRWPSLRNQRTFRRLVGLAGTWVVIMLLGATLAVFGSTWFFVPWVAGLAGVAATLHLVRTVTGSVIDAPVGALDEIQLAQRNSARSLGYWAIFSLIFFPYLMLIWMGSTMDYVRGDTVYGVGVLLVSLVVAAAALPPLLVAWWTNDPDPEDRPDVIVVDEPPSPPAAAPSVAESPPASPQTAPLHSESSTPASTVRTSDLDPPRPAPW
ncbi:hypothetical protein [Williamsia sp. CHRR-6]|uniref:hypothetical protein n=1 Tax=Williamsia sp. CHRR-6 TaxID=2835871 RepID=UPI001BDB5713|nr:hypothetical protein [Williamsia sp. CHRR-6]MBT0566462.1 hypothetical protein [Williamsia sp. CHRR-6]